ncbi:MAG TPA: M20/M25/M40 family metallo-hydrolase [Polyangia bacterium]|jgi:acetylornithine deacetylase
MRSDPWEILERLVAVDTSNPGGDEGALAQLVAEELALRAPDAIEVATIERRGSWGAAVWARFGAPRLCLNAHLDTVPPGPGWTRDPFAAVTEGGRLYGRGAADTKGAIAAMIAALDVARPRDTLLLFTGDEEVGSASMRSFLAAPAAQGLTHAIIGEPTSLRVATRHRGILAGELRAAGPGGHSSRADALPAPAAAVARAAAALADWGVSQRGAGPAGLTGMCVNVAQLAGGVAFNVIPREARLVFSARPWPGAEQAAVRRAIEEVCRRAAPGIELRWTLDNPPFATRTPAVFGPLLGEAATDPVDLGYWTEAALFAAAGIDAVVCGPGDIADAHGPDEQVAVAQLAAACERYAGAYQATRRGSTSNP